MREETIHSRAQWLRGGQMISGDLQTYFPFLDGRKHVVSLVGGGGKSTLLVYLADCFAVRGMNAAVMTTTRMACPAHICQTMEDCRDCWARGEYAACGERTENGKFRAPEEKLLHALLEEADAIIVEADGAHMRACKAPAEHEPVILPQSDIVIGVMGIEVIGGRIGDVCHRPQHVCALLGCDENHRLTAADLADILVSEQGTKKNVDERDYFVVLNKCDDEQRQRDGEAVLAELMRRGLTNAVLNSFV